MSDDLVPDLASAILDGTPIDWATAESSADNTSRPLLAHLRVVETLAGVHRRLQLHEGPDASGARVDRGLSAFASAKAEDTQTHWGHLRTLERIGCGAYGEVYRAWDTRLDREVALKLLAADPSVSDSPPSSIIQEGRLLARVRHPNVVTIYGAEQIGARVGLWMEFVRGRTLKKIVDAGQVFSEADAVQMGIDLCQAVAAVHGAGVLHRDIKAQNAMLADDGRTVLMDFGTGRELADNVTSDLAGTPLYAAPEILAGGDATIQSDIYSLGVLLYHLVTGSYPVGGRSLADVRQAHQCNERTPIRTARPDLSPGLARIIERAIDHRPDHRYPGAEALAADLAALKGRSRLARVSYAICVAAVGLLLAGLVWEGLGRQFGSSRRPSVLLAGVAGGEPNVTPIGSPVIAVLPFKNLSAEPDSDYFVDGLTDEVIRNLAVIDGLTVRSSNSSFTFKNKPRNTRQVGEQLNANLVLDASVLRAGAQVRINVQLVRAADDVPLWSGRFDRELKDIFAIQDEISRAIVNKLRLTLGRGQRRYDTDPEAYELYLKGRALIGRRGTPNFQKAAEAFQQVLVKDPAFAPAHAGVAMAYAFMGMPRGSPVPFEKARSIMRTAAVKALELDPLLADAYAAMGWTHALELDWSSAEKAFQRSIDLNPTLSQTYTSYSISTLRPLGKQDDALRLLRVALQSDPLSLEVQREIGQVQVEAGRYEDAINTLLLVREVEPDFPFAGTYLARALVFAGRPAEALPLFEEMAGGPLGRPPRLALAYVMLGRRAEAEALAAEHADGLPSSLVVIYAALGDKNRALDALERMAVAEPQRVPLQLVQPEMAVLRGDPRFRALRERFRLPPQ